jgi:hypothetical protein
MLKIENVPFDWLRLGNEITHTPTIHGLKNIILFYVTMTRRRKFWSFFSLSLRGHVQGEGLLEGE